MGHGAGGKFLCDVPMRPLGPLLCRPATNTKSCEAALYTSQEVHTEICNGGGRREERRRKDGGTHASLTAMTAIFWLAVGARGGRGGCAVPMGATAAPRRVGRDREDKLIFHTSGFRDAPPRHRHLGSVRWQRLQLFGEDAHAQQSQWREGDVPLLVKVEGGGVTHANRPCRP